MDNQNLEKTVHKFKDFINRHPELIVKVRKSGRSWQEYYDKWAILGEDDPFWNQYKSQREQSKEQDHQQFISNDQYRQLYNQFMKITEKVDLNKVQKQVGELNNTIQTVDDLLKQFLEKRKSPPEKQRPFHWFQD